MLFNPKLQSVSAETLDAVNKKMREQGINGCKVVDRKLVPYTRRPTQFACAWFLAVVSVTLGWRFPFLRAVFPLLSPELVSATP